MVLKLIDRKMHVHTFVNSVGDKIQLTLVLYDLESPLLIGDKIKIDDRLLDKQYPEFAKCYFFGSLEAPYGRKITSKSSPDLLAIKTKGKTILLKRFFG